jgi:class 3 adenylate cyclase
LRQPPAYIVDDSLGRPAQKRMEMLEVARAALGPNQHRTITVTTPRQSNALQVAEESVPRRLAAIMATDLVGYSRLMHLDERGTLASLSTIREVMQDQIKQHRGRIANTAGDSVLAEFGSAVEAVNCAMAVQESLLVNDST